MFSEAVLVAFLMTIPPTLAALATFIVAWRTSKKADVIHDQVNSNLSETVKARDVSLARTEELTRLLVEANQRIDRLGESIERKKPAKGKR